MCFPPPASCPASCTCSPSLTHAIRYHPPRQAAAALATRLAAAPHAVAAALADSALLGSLAAALEAPSTAVSPDAKLDILACFRVAATRSAVRETVSRRACGCPSCLLLQLPFRASACLPCRLARSLIKAVPRLPSAPSLPQMEREGAPAATVAALRAATEVGDWPLAGEAAWALEIMGGMSRRLTREIGWVGG